jgi:hypothetical protein
MMVRLSVEKLKIPCHVKVHRDYDALDAYAKSLGYDNHGNDKDFCGWIPTMGDELHNPLKMMEEGNDKLECAQRHYEKAVIGLCQTGNFSVGYTIYTKGKYH